LEDAELPRRTILASFHGRALREIGAADKKAAVPSNMIAAASRTLKVNMRKQREFFFLIQTTFYVLLMRRLLASVLLVVALPCRSTNAWFSGCKWQVFQVSSKERADCSSFFVLPPGNEE